MTTKLFRGKYGGMPIVTNIVLLPGLFSPTCFLKSLRKRLEREGYVCHYSGLLDAHRVIARFDSCVVVGHSLGGYIGVREVMKGNDRIRLLIGLGTPLMGSIKLPIPYYEARSITDGLLPLRGATEIKQFLTTHALLPYDHAVQDWVVTKLQELKYNKEESIHESG